MQRYNITINQSKSDVEIDVTNEMLNKLQILFQITQEFFLIFFFFFKQVKTTPAAT